jgi:hypothetical protein
LREAKRKMKGWQDGNVAKHQFNEIVKMDFHQKKNGVGVPPPILGHYSPFSDAIKLADLSFKLDSKNESKSKAQSVDKYDVTSQVDESVVKPQVVESPVVPPVVEEPQENKTSDEESNVDVKSVSGDVEEVEIPDERSPKKNDDIPPGNHILVNETTLKKIFKPKVEKQTESINVFYVSNIDFSKKHGIMDPKHKIIYGYSSDMVTRVYHRDTSVPVTTYSEVAPHAVPPKTSSD